MESSDFGHRSFPSPPPSLCTTETAACSSGPSPPIQASGCLWGSLYNFPLDHSVVYWQLLGVRSGARRLRLSFLLPRKESRGNLTLLTLSCQARSLSHCEKTEMSQNIDQRGGIQATLVFEWIPELMLVVKLMDLEGGEQGRCYCTNYGHFPHANVVKISFS